MEENDKYGNTEFDNSTKEDNPFGSSKVPLQGIKDSLSDYINLKIDDYKLRGVEGLAIVSNKTIFLLLATMVGGVVLQLLGFCFAYLLGAIVGSTALGFFIVACIFLVLLIILFFYRKKLFTDKLVKLYISLFFKD